MCGIVGYIGKEDPKEILLKGLEKLEYRGYDSAGIAVLEKTGTKVFKEKGRISTLREIVDKEAVGRIGIGHTRWATHGKPNQVNAHPHQSETERFTLVHNGVIRNYHILKDEYLQGYPFKSETDTEVIVQLIEKFVEEGNSVEDSFRKTLVLLDGSYAIAMIDAQDQETFYVAKNESPLLVGLGEGCNIVASSFQATLNVTKTYMELMDKEIAIIKEDEVIIRDFKGNLVQRKPFEVNFDESDFEKGLHPHFMLKEIDEQPIVIRKIMQEYRDSFDQSIVNALTEADRLYVVACGTSYHAGMLGKQYFEKLAGIPVEVHIASEFIYNTPFLSEKPLFIFISQSGETADSRAALVEVKKRGYKVLTLTNVPGSTLSREADHTVLLHAGPEIAVASTKAYSAQIAVLMLLASESAKAKGIQIGFDPIQELSVAANAMETLVSMKKEIEKIAREYLETTRSAFFIGRTMDYFVCLEAALKLKEISYIQAEGYPGGELKHGPIALIEEGTPVFALITQEDVNLHTRGNVKEVMARGAKACIISTDDTKEEGDRFIIPKVHPLLAPLSTIVPLQLLSYYAALHRGCDVDKPRNLAKSVTVE